MNSDQLQRQQALDPSRSFIVQAPAGSGKTGLLVQRVLRLLSLVDRPESVVAVTFTRKAASEMKDRVLKALQDAAGPLSQTLEPYEKTTRDLAVEVLEQDRKKGWRLLEDSSRLQIQTIDSLCALLTRQMPVLSEFGGAGEVIEDAADLYLRAVRDTLTELAEGTGEEKELFRRIVLHFDNDVSRLETHMIKMLGKRDQWEHLTPTDDAQLVQDFCSILRRTEGQLRIVFRDAGKVDFAEIARAARRALGKPDQPSDLLYSLDFRLQHLLVDEFQDTSRSQYELIKALTEQWSLGDDHTLFLVGDPMQSIYRFREADVGLFLKCWREQRIGGVELHPLVLENNFRSTGKILQWIEAHFETMMPADDLHSGAVKFRKSSAGRSTRGIQPQIFAQIEDSGITEADEVVRIVRKSKGKKVGILVRSRSHTTHIIPALRRAGIVYEAVKIELLSNQQHIIDVLSLTRALTDVADRVSWMACLRAPWCGLTLADLSTLAEGRGDRAILDLISDPELLGRLSIDGRRRIVRVQEILANAVKRIGRDFLRRVVEQTWQQLGGLAALHPDNEREDVSTLLALIEQTEEGGMIRDFGLLNKKLEFLYARPASTNADVAIMTIFEAKGLEFDVVILPQLAKRVRGYEKELLVWTECEDENGFTDLVIAAMPQAGVEHSAYEEITNLAKERDENESRRLFYVACTRAIDELHLIGSAARRRNGLGVDKGTFLHVLWNFEDVQKEFESKKLAVPTTTRQMNLAFSSTGVMLSRLPVNWSAPRAARDYEPEQRVRRVAASERQISYHWVGDKSRHAGTVIHEILKRIASDGLELWSDSHIGEAGALITSELQRMGLTLEQNKTAVEQVFRAVRNTIKSARGRWILASHPGARSEWAVAGKLGDRLVSGTIDRSFRDAEGTQWIIDFKNSEHSGGQKDQFLANEKSRYQAQLEQYAALVSRLIDTPISLGLYFPLLDEWLEWPFAESVAAKG